MVSSPACRLPIPQLHSRQLFEVTAKLLNVTTEKGKMNEILKGQRIEYYVFWTLFFETHRHNFMQ